METSLKLPCPNCGSLLVSLHHKTQYGHGDSGYTDLRVKCQSCSLSIGDGSDYGNPSVDASVKVIGLWNEMVDKLTR